MNEKVASEILELHRQISVLRDLVSPLLQPKSSNAILVSVGRSESARRPFTVQFKGRFEKTVHLSAIRAAILLALLQELELRFSSKASVPQVRDIASKLFQMIVPGSFEENRVHEQVRVGLYRFQECWKDEFSEVFPADFDSSEERLATHNDEVLEVEISSSDETIENALRFFGRTPMLQKLQREKFLFIPGEPGYAERFLSEIYASADKLKVTSAYGRMQLITVPCHLIEKYNTVPEVAARHTQMHVMLSEGRLSFTEFLPASGFEELVARGPDARFAYFPAMEHDELLEHLYFLHHLLTLSSGYRLVVMRSDIPFYVGQYEAQDFGLTAFIKFPTTGLAAAHSSFVIWGGEIGETASKGFFDTMLRSRSAISDPKEVSIYLESIITRLKH